MSEERIELHFVSGRIVLDGRVATDLDAPAPAGSRWVIARS